MTNLSRKEQLIFANNKTNNQVAVFGSKAQSGTMSFSDDPNIIQNIENEGINWNNGWESAVINGNSPLMEDFNAISYVNSYNMAYVLQKGIPEYSSNTTYYKGDICLIINEGIPSLYYSLIDNNKGNNPTEETTKWGLFYNLSIIDNIMNRINKIETKITATKIGLPDDTNYTDLTFGASGTEYTAPDDGYFYLAGSLGSTGFNVNALVKISLTDNSRYQEASGSSLQGNYVLFFPVSKGQKVIITYSSVYATATTFRFIPLLKQVLPDIPEEEEEVVEEEEAIEEETTGEITNG